MLLAARIFYSAGVEHDHMSKTKEPRKFACPWGGYVLLPGTWLGEHAARREEAFRKAEKASLPNIFARFSAALAVLEDWSGIPGMEGNPEKWDLAKLDWGIMAWLIGLVEGDIAGALEVPKVFYSPLPAGQAAEETTSSPSGSSESEAQTSK